jgi:CheY-like chemotaxis protein
MTTNNFSLNLLIVDDHAETRQLIRQMIGDFAAQIRECASGEEALKMCETFTPHVVTMDLQMKSIDGFEAMQRILVRHPNAVVIVVTQSNSLELRVAATRAGAKFFVVKDELAELRYLFERRLVSKNRPKSPA